jgi:hypothetical protein
MNNLGNQGHAVIQTFLNNDKIFQDDNGPNYTAGTVQLWFEEPEGQLQHHSWAAQSRDLKIIEQLWSVLDT